MSTVSSILRWIRGVLPTQKGDLTVDPSDGLARIYRAGAARVLEDQGNKGVAGGYAELDGSGKVPSSQLPAGGGGLPAPASGTGLIVYDGAATLTRSLAGTANRIVITDPDGVSGPPTIDIGSTVLTSSSAASGDASGTLGALQVDRARGLRESGGTTLANGAVADGTVLVRSGTSLIGVLIGAAGGLIQAYSALLAAIAAIGAGTGYLVKTGTNTVTVRSLAGGSGVTITNPDGVAGPTTISFSGGTGQDDDPTTAYTISITPSNATLFSRDGGITVRSAAAGNLATRRATALTGAFADFYTTNMNVFQTRWTISGAASIKVRWVTGASVAATCRYKFGFTGGGLTSSDAETALRDTVMFRYVTGLGHTKWMAYSQNASGSEETDSGVTVSANTEYLLEIQLSSTQAVFYINGAIVATHTTYRPSTSQDLGFQGGVYASSRTIYVVGSRFNVTWA